MAKKSKNIPFNFLFFFKVGAWVSDELKITSHYKQEGHKEEDMGVVAIEEVKGKDDLYRVTRERFWIGCLGTYNEENKRK